MSHFPYHFFEEYVVRTPLLSRRNFQEKAGEEEFSDKELKGICEDLVFQEAIYLASPNLYNELKNWLYSEKELSSSQHQKLKNTILKYYSRMSTRCTPFGLFSGVDLGKFNEDSKIGNRKQPTESHLRNTKLDMHFVVGLSGYLAKIPKIKNQLLFSPNNSINTIGNKIRYVEYQYTNGKRDYIISSAPLSKELRQVLEFSKQGKTLQQIAESLINEEIIQQEAEEFIEELIENQVLVSELDPNVSGKDFLETVISVLNRTEAKNEVEILLSIQKNLEKLDESIGNPISVYEEIENLIKSFQTEYEQKYLFQTDLYFKNEFDLSFHWKKELKKGISFLNKITLPQKATRLDKFKKAFSERFETQEVPLSLALDTEIGIGYGQEMVATKGLHPYLDNLRLPVSQKQHTYSIQLTSFHKILIEKLQDALLENQLTIELTNDDFKDFEENWQDLPDTISFVAEIISEDNQEKLCIGSSGGSTAANLLGRFCSEKSEVRNLAKSIVRKEKALNQEYILAEIIHLPEARIGNIIRRPTLRQYEIPYLAQSVLPRENQIFVEDLYISLRNDRIVLRSKRLDKEIKPYLTNAHNYHTNTLPVYHFLSDLHSQNKRTGLYFDWGDLKHIYKFLPRVEYKNIILSKAQWRITEKDVISLEALVQDKKEFSSEMKNWRARRKIPLWIQWTISDNTLPLNLENYDMAILFIQTVKSKKSIIIEEFLYNENDDFTHEFIFPLYKGR